MTTKSETQRGRVLRSVGGVYTVEVDGEVVECSLRGRLKREKGIGRVAVGDEVEIERPAEGGCVITAVLPRSAVFSRSSADGRRRQIIATNLDQLAAIFSVAQPTPLLDLLDRFLVQAESNEIAAFIVANKVDLSGESEAKGQFDTYERVGYEVIYTSAKTGRNLERLRERLAGHMTLFVGPSGAGKSSLLNALQPGLGLRVGEVSRALQRGRHTTVAASLQPLDVGGYVVDTPGLGVLKFWEVEGRELGWSFPEFRPYLGECKFQDCTHVHEPGCAIIAARDAGAIPERRYESYRKMLEEG